MIVRALAVLSLILTLAACATPAIQPPRTPPPGFTGPSLAADAVIVDDGARLPLARWTPEGEPWAVIVALHGMNDSRASFRLAGPWWAEQGIETWAIDQRGFGQTPRPGRPRTCAPPSPSPAPATRAPPSRSPARAWAAPSPSSPSPRTARRTPTA